MMGIFYILIVISAISVVRAVREIVRQRGHLKDEEIEDFVKMRIETSSDAYTRFIGHIAGCETCQQRLDDAQRNPDKIENHLI